MTSRLVPRPKATCGTDESAFPAIGVSRTDCRALGTRIKAAAAAARPMPSITFFSIARSVRLISRCALTAWEARREKPSCCADDARFSAAWHLDVGGELY